MVCSGVSGAALAAAGTDAFSAELSVAEAAGVGSVVSGAAMPAAESGASKRIFIWGVLASGAMVLVAKSNAKCSRRARRLRRHFPCSRYQFGEIFHHLAARIGGA